MRFDSYHPMLSLIYFVAAFAATICFDHPIFLGIAYFAAFFYSVKLRGRRQLMFNLCLLPWIFLYAVYYASYHHFGVTVLWSNFIGNRITLEAMVYGMVLGAKVVTVLMWCSCMFELVSSDKVVYLFGRVSPKLSLFLAILLRSIPRIKKRTEKIELAREGIGRGYRQGNLLLRMSHMLKVISILITWTLEELMESSISMKSRGYSLKGRTAFSKYRFDHRDRCVVLAMSACLTGILMAVLLDQTVMYYAPVLLLHKVTYMSVVFYVVYGIFLLLPFGLQLFSERSFRRAGRRTLEGVKGC